MAVAPYDAELFGHWWFEGPEFLEAVLRGLAARAEAGGVEAIGLGAYLERHPRLHRVSRRRRPGGRRLRRGVDGTEGGAAVAARAPRGARGGAGAGAAVGGRGAARARAGAGGARLLLLEASDWPFMIHGGDTAQYAEARMRRHRGRVARLVAVAQGRGPVGEDDARWVEALRADTPFLASLPGEVLLRAFDRWG
ncbi:MAG: 1,4-alpha-glucan branching protein domain-containing protein [Polyangiaceae bacterium]